MRAYSKLVPCVWVHQAAFEFIENAPQVGFEFLKNVPGAVVGCRPAPR